MRSKAEERARKKKIRDDGRRLAKYKERLINTTKTYMQTYEADAINQRRSRVMALGTCALKALDGARGLAKTKQLADGSLEYMINEQKIVDPDGRIGFHCSVTFKVGSLERAFTDQEIDREIEDTFERMMAETDELFPEDPPEEDDGDE